jgi:hypothetical protein
VKTVTGARIVTPGDWSDLDLHPSSRHGSIRRAVRQAVMRDPGLEGNAVRLIGLLDDIARRAYDSGGFFCSSLVLGSLETGLLVANVLIQITPDDEKQHVAGAADWCAGMAAAVSCDPDWAEADVSVVALPFAGEAVRLVVASGGVCVQYLVPVAESAQQFVLTFTSPYAPNPTPLISLFDSMASSFAPEYDDIDGDSGDVLAGVVRFDAATNG